MTASKPTTHRTDTEWQRWGELDPYFGVITKDKFRRQNLTPAALEEFFATGRQHVEHLMRVCRTRLHPKFQPARVLDFGCGVGRIAAALAERCDEVVGVDISPAMLAEARRNCEARGLHNVAFVPSDDALSQVTGDFDLIHSVLVLQHIEPARVRGLVLRMFERLRVGGVAALHVTYAKSYHPDTFGQPPAPPAPPAQPDSRWRLALRRRETVSTATPPAMPAPGDPEMLMYAHSLNDLFFTFQQAGAQQCHLEFTNHGGELGVIAYTQRKAK